MERVATDLVWALAAALGEEWAEHWYPGMPRPEDAPEGTEALWKLGHAAIWTKGEKEAIEKWTLHKGGFAKVPSPRTARDFWHRVLPRETWPILGVNIDWDEGESVEVYVERYRAVTVLKVRTVATRLYVRGAPDMPPYLSVEGYWDPRAERAVNALLHRALVNVATLLEEGEAVEATHALTSMWTILGGVK